MRNPATESNRLIRAALWLALSGAMAVFGPLAVASVIGAPEAPERPFANVRCPDLLAITPKVARSFLEATLESEPIGKTIRINLDMQREGNSSTNYAVATRTSNGVDVYVEKTYDHLVYAERDIPALEFARALHESGQMNEFSVVQVLSAAPRSPKVRLSLAEGAVVRTVLRDLPYQSALRSSVLTAYQAALKKTELSLQKAGYTVNRNSDSLFIYRGNDFVFQILPQNVVITPSGQLILFDPF